MPAQSRISVLALLAGADHDYLRMARPLLRSLEGTQHFNIDVATDPDHLDVEGRRVLLVASDHHLQAGQAELITEFVRGGGGVVVLHGTLATWVASGDVTELAGWAPTGPAPVTELVVRTDRSHPLTQRLGPELKLTDELYLSEGPPSDATILLRTSWHFTEQVVAYERAVGAGRFVHIGLGHQASTYDDLSFQKLLHRTLLFAAGREAAAPVGVGLIGYGAIAAAHATAISATSGLRLRGICDVSSERRELAGRDWRVPTHATAQGLFDDPEVELVIVGTPPSAHADSVLAALAAGKHVVCEKPFALRVQEVDWMIDSAASRDRVLTVYQSRRWDPDYVAMREVVRSGRIGELFYMESFIGGYSHPCDFWHSHEPVSGGTIYDWGSHYFDWVLQLFPEAVKTVSAVGHKRVWHDVTNSDQVRVDLTFEGGAQATFLQSDIAAAMKPKWYVLGTRGAVVGEWREETVQSRSATGDLVEERLAPSESPARVKVMRPAEDGGSHEEVLVLARREENAFYRNLADHLAWDEPLAVPPEEARRTVAVMEAATHSIARGGRQVEVDI
ncbi:MAG TPA: Gfo/Idh/MocA family oxidoreductase [Candidatus Dormibacteraeota bacterium]|nr:Gfo/Idh/MocA family oxidoreductase [Candidatus Dormibacteraeota bacterium]